MNDRPIDLLIKYYGYKSFRKGQEDIIDSIINKKDVLAIMPTGGGKSICYQIPALVFDGLTIVISPLISLMKDQVDSLNELGINAAYINSTLTAKEFRSVLESIKNNELKMLYIAPERLDSDEFVTLISNKSISQVAIDEAHCVSQWGHDFRQSYRKISQFIGILRVKPVVTAFTATASNEVKEDIERLLLLENPDCFITGFDRENLCINIVKNSNKKKYLLDYAKKHNTESGIVYAATRKEVEKIYELLDSKGFSVSKYHAGLSNNERSENQNMFIKDNIDIMVATNAFGMGIDKPNIRWVIHYNMPQSIENYYQEIGRAGRDGEKSECVMMFTPGDIQVQKYLIDIGIDNLDRKLNQHKKLQNMTDLVYSNSCYRRSILEYFGEELKDDCGNCSNCLNEGQIVDRTLDAQKVISCVYRMKRPYGITTIVDVLRGSKNKRILQLGFEKLSTYNIMKNFSAEDLKVFINTLVSHGYLDMVESLGFGGRGSFPTIHLNDVSMDILKGNVKVEFKQDIITEVVEVRDELYEILRSLRKEISASQRIAPYMVFGDGTLKNMSSKMPTNKDAMLDISGVGQIKYEKYGQVFVDAIKKYIEEHKEGVNTTVGSSTEIVSTEIASSSISKENINLTLTLEDLQNKDIDSNQMYIETSVTDDEFFIVNSDNELYNLLNEYRENLAKKEKVLPYMILSKDSLKEISGRYPTDEKDLADITGIGLAKIKKYGKSILEIVKNYTDENNIQSDWIMKKNKKLILDGESRKKNEITLDLLNEGKSIAELSEELEVSQSTIIGYVDSYVEEGNSISFNLNLDVYFDSNDREIVLEAVKKHGSENLNTLKRKLPDNIKYETIRAVLLDEKLEESK